MTRLIFVAEIQSKDFEPEMKLDGAAPELAAALLLDVLQRGKVVWGTVSKIPESAGQVIQ